MGIDRPRPPRCSGLRTLLRRTSTWEGEDAPPDDAESFESFPSLSPGVADDASEAAEAADVEDVVDSIDPFLADEDVVSAVRLQETIFVGRSGDWGIKSAVRL